MPTLHSTISHRVPDPTRQSNLTRMAAWVDQVRGAAVTMPDPTAMLMEWHDWLGRKMSDLGDEDCHRSLRGLTAFDLGEAQIALLRPLAV